MSPPTIIREPEPEEPGGGLVQFRGFGDVPAVPPPPPQLVMRAAAANIKAAIRAFTNTVTSTIRPAISQRSMPERAALDLMRAAWQPAAVFVTIK
jgi:hypothetical protein